MGNKRLERCAVPDNFVRTLVDAVVALVHVTVGSRDELVTKVENPSKQCAIYTRIMSTIGVSGEEGVEHAKTFYDAQLVCGACQMILRDVNYKVEN